MKKLVLKRTSIDGPGKGYRIDYEAELNPSQLDAVMHRSGPALVLAGAGTGKTRTLTYRVARLVEDGVDPSSILLLTFTRKAAREMLRRAGTLLDGRCDKVAGGTFHSFAFSVLQRFGRDPGVQSDRPSTILDQSDAEDVMNLVRGRTDLGVVKRRFPKKSTLLSMTSMAVNTMTALDDVIAERYPQFLADADKIGEVVRGYQDYKARNGMFDYDDLLLYLLSMTRHEEVGPLLRKQFRHVMVDEYQDTNVLQHSIIMGLAGSATNVLAVGDDAQSIYSFRGADVRNIHAFPSAFPDCKVIKLEQNYRSTQPILDVCNGIIRDSPLMFEKELFTDVREGDAPMLVACTNERQQSSFVVQQILELRENGTPLSDICVLFRSGFLSFDLEVELGKANIPFRKLGGLRFAEAAHVKDVLAMLRITVNPRDMISWYRLLQLLPGVGQKTARTIIDDLASTQDPLVEWPSSGKKAEALCDALRSARDTADGVERTRSLTEYYRPLFERQFDDHAKRWRDIETILAMTSRYQRTEEFLAEIALEPPSEAIDEIGEDDGEEEVMTLSTIHSAKGLEWRSVFVIWVNEGRIPSARSADSESSLEEERRLLYVACTRAKESLILTYPNTMVEWEHSDVLGQPSRFLDGVDKESLPQYALAEFSADDEGQVEGQVEEQNDGR
jgi:DNA helicase II / ATP-dependent DNA helicase PcrA